MIRIGKYVLGHLDIEAGDFTYGNRIVLGDIFRDDKRSDYQKMRDAFIELYGWPPRLLPVGRRVKALRRMVAEFKLWLDKEQQLLAFDPEPDQLAAGIKELARKVGDMGTVKALAKAYGQDPDTVLKWDYSKVFGILFTDLEEYKYDKRFNKVLDAKYSRRHPRRGA